MLTTIKQSVETLYSGKPVTIKLDLSGYELLRDVFTIALHHTDNRKQYSDFRRLWRDIDLMVKQPA